MSYKKWCQNPDDVPSTEHFAILYFGTIHVPGDERSRQAPGHGYPEHTETKIDYVVFPSRETWEAEIKHNTESVFGGRNWKAIYVKPAIVETKVRVDVSIK